MIKLLVIFSIGLIISACSEEGVVDETKESIEFLSYAKVCVDNIVYYNGNQKLAPAFNVDGTIKTCSKVVK